MNGNRPGKAIIRKRLKNRSAGEIARLLGIKQAHVYNVESRGVSPTLHRAMVRAGWLKRRKRRKVYAVAFHLHDESTAVALRRIFDRYGRNRREVAEKLVSGELRIVEVNSDLG